MFFFFFCLRLSASVCVCLSALSVVCVRGCGAELCCLSSVFLMTHREFLQLHQQILHTCANDTTVRSNVRAHASTQSQSTTEGASVHPIPHSLTPSLTCLLPAFGWLIVFFCQLAPFIESFARTTSLPHRLAVSPTLFLLCAHTNPPPTPCQRCHAAESHLQRGGSLLRQRLSSWTKSFGRVSDFTCSTQMPSVLCVVVCGCLS